MMAGVFTQVVLFTDVDGRARFKERDLPLSEGTPAALLSPMMPASASAQCSSAISSVSAAGVTVCSLSNSTCSPAFGMRTWIAPLRRVLSKAWSGCPSSSMT